MWTCRGIEQREKEHAGRNIFDQYLVQDNDRHYVQDFDLDKHKEWTESDTYEYYKDATREKQRIQMVENREGGVVCDKAIYKEIRAEEQQMVEY